MCFGGGKTPDIPAPPPPPAPNPVPTPSEPTEVASQTAEQRSNVAKQAQYGILSTIKTSAGGIAGAGPDLIAAAAGGQTGKKTLGGS